MVVSKGVGLSNRTDAANGMGLFNGWVVLVTGGGGGLGQATCLALARDGAIVVPADVNESAAGKVVAQVEQAGGRAVPMRIDLRDAAQVEQRVAELTERFGRLDVVVNNAGTDVTTPVEELAVADWDRVMDVNLRAPFLMSRACFPIMKAQGGGHIVNIASTASKRAWANASVYHASKWGLVGLSHALHVEGRPHGIKVTAIIAGGMRTPFLIDRFPDIDVSLLQDPANVAETIRFVLSQPPETVIPEIMVLPMRETSWP